jgi:hypothetical protein
MENTSRTATRLAKGAALVGAGALGATILTGVAFADSDTSANGSGSAISAHAEGRGHGGPGGSSGPGGPGGQRGMGHDRVGEMLHSEAVVETPSGELQTVATVRGEVTAVSDSAITVRAADGYERTFAVTADTEVSKSREDAAITNVVVGDQAMVNGVVTGDTTTAERVHAMTAEEAAEREAQMTERRAEMQQKLQERLDELNSTTSS